MRGTHAPCARTPLCHTRTPHHAHTPATHAHPTMHALPSLQRDAVNEQVVRILLECILVLFIFVLHIRLCFMKVKRRY